MVSKYTITQAVSRAPMFLKVTAFPVNVKILPEIFLWPDASFWSIVFRLLSFAKQFFSAHRYSSVFAGLLVLLKESSPLRGEDSLRFLIVHSCNCILVFRDNCRANFERI